MAYLAQILLVLLIPIQFLPIGFAFNNGQQNTVLSNQKSQVQGASTSPSSSSEKIQSMRGSILQNQSQNEDSSTTGFVPQRLKNFKPTKIFASASVVLDVDSGTILHYDSGRIHMPIASLTKMMTATVIVENVKNLDEQVTIDEESVSADGTKVGCPTSVLCTSERLHVGEKVTVKDLLTAMLLDSANDAAIALGKYVAGSQQGFADMMNEKAKELNLSDSHFCNPSGLDIDGCYSSAYDLARIAANSMKYNIIWKIMKMQDAEIGSCDGRYVHVLKNTDMLLGEIPNCLGGKTGFTYNAGKSLMIAAADPGTNKHRIIAVILNDNNRWEDMRSLLNWTFASYEWK
jgi:serine-type D-Ala-D-Ala carboxypeptidase (penicillin-binding protein 5/6)